MLVVLGFFGLFLLAFAFCEGAALFLAHLDGEFRSAGDVLRDLASSTALVRRDNERIQHENDLMRLQLDIARLERECGIAVDLQRPPHDVR